MKATRAIGVIGAAALAAGAFAVGAPVAADEARALTASDETPPVVIGDAPNAAGLAMMAVLAERDGSSVEVAIARYGWQDDFSLAVDQIRREVPEHLSAAEITGEDSAMVSFVGVPPAVAVKALERVSNAFSHVEISVEGGAGFSEMHVESALVAVHQALMHASGTVDVSTVFESGSRLIVSDIGADSAASIAVLEAAAASAMSTSAGGGFFSVHVRAAPGGTTGATESSVYHHGGEVLSTCTSGFGTYVSGAGRGIATAGHCNDAQSDDGSSLSFSGDYEGTHGDFQVHTGPKIETDNFYFGSGTVTETNITDVTNVSTPSVGQTICLNGRTTHLSCQEVRKFNVCANGYCNLIQLGSHLSAAGDSGGPIFSGSIAYGIHSGYHYDPWPYDRQVFSRADRLDNALGTYIATN